jgi:hypothetical protein
VSTLAPLTRLAELEDDCSCRTETRRSVFWPKGIKNEMAGVAGCACPVPHRHAHAVPRRLVSPSLDFSYRGPCHGRGNRTGPCRVGRNARYDHVGRAVIFTHRLDMAPDGMATMKSRLAALPSTEPGIYPFKADLAMAGNCASPSPRRCRARPVRFRRGSS